MVRLNTSLLAVTLATSSALACANEYQRRDVGQEVVPHHHRRPLRFGLACGHHNNVDEDSEDIFVRDDAFDEFEAREPQAAAGIVKGASSVIKAGAKLFEHKNTKTALKAADYGSQAYGAYTAVKNRGLEDDEDLFVRDLDANDDLEAREPLGAGLFKGAGSALKFGSRFLKHKHTRHAFKALDYGSQAYGAVQNRGLEDDEDLFLRDLDANDDLEARDPLGAGLFKGAGSAFKFGSRLLKHKHTRHAFKALDYGSQAYGAVQNRGLEDDDIFVRDLDTEEVFGRESDLLDERDAFDDLD